MSIRRVSLISAVALTIILSSLSLNAQQPRTVPPNDSFMQAQPIVIGSAYSIPDIGAATNEAGEPTTACRWDNGDTVIPHSVWFTFTQPVYSYVSVSTFGSLMLMNGAETSMDTVLAVYELTGPSNFARVACSDNAYSVTAAQLVFAVDPDKTYYIAAGTYLDFPFLPESILNLNTRMLSTSIFPLNNNFEEPISDPGWKLKNADDDQIVCSDPVYWALADECVFRFVGTAGTKTKLTQSLPFPPYFVPRKDAFLSFGAFFRVMDTAALGSTKIRVIVRYSDGTPPSTHVVDLTGTADWGFYYTVPFDIALKSSEIASVKLAVKFGSPTGILLLDYVYYFYSADSMTRASSLLPVPPAAN